MHLFWQSFSNGLLISGGLIMAIGTQNVFVLAQGLRREHHGLVAMLCITCDAALVAAGVFGLAAVLLEHPLVLSVARWGGAGFLLWYGVKALRRAWAPSALTAGLSLPRSRRTVLLSALAVTLLNPHVYLDTVLLIGSLGAQQGVPLAFVVGAACASTLWFASLAYGSARLAPWLARPTTWRWVDCGVALMMFTVAGQLILAR